MAKTLVVYYSQSRGNTKKIAREIASTLGADLAAIDTVQPYNCSYDELVYGLSKTETQNKVCPPIKPLDKDPAYYDRIVLGTPTWWYTMAPAVRTFLTETDLTGKELVLFATHGGWAEKLKYPAIPKRPADSAGGFYFMVDIWLRVCYNRDKIKERKCNDALY